jgi:thiol-disulfide isomerase/thioredoxin
VSRGYLIIVLAVCGLGYMRGEQPALWNSWMKQLGASDAFNASLAPKKGLFDEASTQPVLPTPQETKLTAEIDAETPKFLPMEDAILNHGNDSDEAWAAFDTKVANYAKKIASTPYTANEPTLRANVVSFREEELMMRRHVPGNYGEYLYLAERLLKDPAPGVADLAREALKPVELKFTSVDGRAIDVARMRGRVVLVDRWTSWCEPCRAEVPALQEVYERFHPDGLEIFGIADDQDEAPLISYVNSHNIPWPQFDPFFQKSEDAWSHVFDDANHPTLFLFDKQGRLLNIVPPERLVQQVATALAQPK